MKARSVFIILILLLGLALILHLAFNQLFYLSMIVAVVKSILIIYYYMELKDQSASMRWISLVTLFWVAILFTMTFADYLSRHLFTS